MLIWILPSLFFLTLTLTLGAFWTLVWAMDQLNITQYILVWKLNGKPFRAFLWILIFAGKHGPE